MYSSAFPSCMHIMHMPERTIELQHLVYTTTSYDKEKSGGQA